MTCSEFENLVDPYLDDTIAEEVRGKLARVLE